MLKAECDRGRVEWRMPCAVAGIETARRRLHREHGRGSGPRGSLVIATGGLTVPKIGATPFGYKIGRTVRSQRRAASSRARAARFRPRMAGAYGDLAGVALDVEVSCNGGRFRENLLFTHRGLSGPAILQISSYWDGKASLAIDLLPGARQRHGSGVSERRPRTSTTCSRNDCRGASWKRGARRMTQRGR